MDYESGWVASGTEYPLQEPEFLLKVVCGGDNSFVAQGLCVDYVTLDMEWVLGLIMYEEVFVCGFPVYGGL